jgi:hypothetical protein
LEIISVQKFCSEKGFCCQNHIPRMRKFKCKKIDVEEHFECIETQLQEDIFDIQAFLNDIIDL